MMREGQIVIIEGILTSLRHRLEGIYEGGWVVDPPIKNIKYWNEQEMKPLPPADIPPG